MSDIYTRILGEIIKNSQDEQLILTGDPQNVDQKGSKDVLKFLGTLKPPLE